MADNVTCPACNRDVCLEPLGATNLNGGRVMQWHYGVGERECWGSFKAIASLIPVPIRDCPSCGKRDENWVAEHKPEVEVRLSRLARNQMVGSAHPNHGHILFTHNCAPRPVPSLTL